MATIISPEQFAQSRAQANNQKESIMVAKSPEVARFIEFLNSYAQHVYSVELARHNKEKSNYATFCQTHAEEIAQYNAAWERVEKPFDQCKKILGELYYKYANPCGMFSKYPASEPLPPNLFEYTDIYKEYCELYKEWKEARAALPPRIDYPYVHDAPVKPAPLPLNAGLKEINHLVLDFDLRKFARYAEKHGFGNEVEFNEGRFDMPDSVCIEVGDIFLIVEES